MDNFVQGKLKEWNLDVLIPSFKCKLYLGKMKMYFIIFIITHCASGLASFLTFFSTCLFSSLFFSLQMNKLIKKPSCCLIKNPLNQWYQRQAYIWNLKSTWETCLLWVKKYTFKMGYICFKCKKTVGANVRFFVFSPKKNA